MANIQFDIVKTDGGQAHLLKDPNLTIGLWTDERETILARIGATKGRPEIGLKLYSVSYCSENEWIIRCVEIINSIDAREKSNITTSLKVKAQFNCKGQQILSIFEAINHDVKNHEVSPSDELLSKLVYTDSNVPWHRGALNGKFGVKTFANPTELVDLLDNILQPEYENYQAVYFIPQDCKFYEDMNYILLKKGTDKLIKKKFEIQEPVKGIIFRPEQPYLTIFESQKDRTRVNWICEGYRTIGKIVTDTNISPLEVYRKINKKDLFSVTPEDASIVCSLDGRKVNEEGDYIYLPWDKVDRCNFLISSVGYVSQNHTLPNSKQTIILKENELSITLKLHACTEVRDISIKLLPSSLGHHNKESLVLCTQNYLSKLKSANEKPTNNQNSSKLLSRSMTILLLCVALLVGSGLGFLTGWFSHTPKPLDDQGASTSKENVTPVSREKKMENYLIQDTWSEGRDDYNNLEPPTGLYRAMNTFSYVDIEGIYDKLNISRGRLEDVHNIINSYGGINTCARPKVNYNSDKDSNIIVSEWIKKVEEVNNRHKQQIEEFLAKPKWDRNEFLKYETNNNCITKELTGLWDAMNQYEYEQISQIYTTLSNRGYNCGNLDTVNGMILKNQVQNFQGTTYCPSKDYNITVERWINKVQKSSSNSSNICADGSNEEASD